MSLRACFGGDFSILLSGEVASWEDVRGGKGRRGLDAVEEQDLVRGRDEEDAIWVKAVRGGPEERWCGGDWGSTWRLGGG